MFTLDHEQVMIRTGPRSGLPVIVAVHSTALGQAVGGCRLWHYADWQDGLTDALRLSAGMTSKCAVAGWPTAAARPSSPCPRAPNSTRPCAAACWTTWRTSSNPWTARTRPDRTSEPHRRTWRSSANTPPTCSANQRSGRQRRLLAGHRVGTLAALRAVGQRLHGTSNARRVRLALVGWAASARQLARLLSAKEPTSWSATSTPAKRAAAGELGATWAAPEQALTADVDILRPRRARRHPHRASRAGAATAPPSPGPPNNQLATPDVAGLLHRRGIVWVPDYVVSAGGVIDALTRELHHGTPTRPAPASRPSSTPSATFSTRRNTGNDTRPGRDRNWPGSASPFLHPRPRPRERETEDPPCLDTRAPREARRRGPGGTGRCRATSRRPVAESDVVSQSEPASVDDGGPGSPKSEEVSPLRLPATTRPASRPSRSS